jgi:hypothetical protein
MGDNGLRGILRIVKAAAWLAPDPEFSDDEFTQGLRDIGLEHGDDIPADVVVRS